MTADEITLAEAALIRYCTACGRALIDDEVVEYDRQTGKRIVTGRIKVCPNRNSSAAEGRRHDLYEIADADVDEVAFSD